MSKTEHDVSDNNPESLANTPVVEEPTLFDVPADTTIEEIEVPVSAVDVFPAFQSDATADTPTRSSSVASGENTPSRRRFLGFLIGGSGAVVLGGAGVVALLAGSSNDKRDTATKTAHRPSKSAGSETSAPETTVPAPTAPTTTPEAVVQSEVPADIRLQVSDNPIELGNQTYNNREAWIRNGDERDPDYIYANTANGQNIKGVMESSVLTARDKVASRPGSYIVLKATPVGEPVFSPDDTSRTVTYEIEEDWEDINGNNIYKTVFTETLTFLPVEKNINQGNGPEPVKEWLIDTQYSSAG